MKRTLKIIYKIITLISLTAGVGLDVIGKDIKIIGSYFTFQSNLICCISFSIFIILEMAKFKYKMEFYYIYKGAITISIALTMIIFHGALERKGLLLGKIDISEVATFLLHTASPILVILDYIIFDVKGNFKLYYPAFWIIIPAIYVVYVYIYSYFGGSYYKIGGSVNFAYYFLDYQQIGILGVVKWIVCIMLLVLLISYILIGFDKKMAKTQKKS